MEKISDTNYDHVTSTLSHPAVIFFYAPWSKPCQPIREILEELADSYQDKVSFFCMDIDENANIPASLGVTKIPSLFALKEGVVTDRVLGRHPRVKLREFIERLHHDSSPP